MGVKRRRDRRKNIPPDAYLEEHKRLYSPEMNKKRRLAAQYLHDYWVDKAREVEASGQKS